jgi:uncharacterized protein YggU (UPF0235/DUF167 family)
VCVFKFKKSAAKKIIVESGKLKDKKIVEIKNIKQY